MFQRTLGLTQGQAHEVVVAWEEALAHRSRPRRLRQCLRAQPPGTSSLPKRPCAPKPATRPLDPRPRALLALAHLRRRCGDCSRRCAAAPCADAGRAPTRRTRSWSVRATSARRLAPSTLGVTARMRPAPGAARRCPRTRACCACAPGASVAAALRRLRARARRGVGGARLLAPRAGGLVIPNDEGRPGGTPGGWQELQWNFVGPFGVNAPEAWANVAADGAARRQGRDRRGARHRRRLRQPRSLPALARLQPRTSSCRGYDFVAKNPYPNDRNGHGTFVAGDDRRGDQQPLRRSPGSPTARASCPCACSTAEGEGEASTIAEGVCLRRPPRRPGDQPQPRVLPRRDRRRHPRADRRAPLRAPPRRARGRRRRQRGPRRDRLSGARARRGLGGRHDRTRLSGLLLQRRRRAHARGARAAAPTRTFPATPTAIPNTPPGGTSSR